MFSPSIEKLIELFAKFPTVGPKTAQRFAFYLSKKSKKDIDELIKTINQLSEKIKFCKQCFQTFEDSGDLCKICQDPRRDQSIVCLVEKETDLEAIENTHRFKGIYLVLGKVLTFRKNEENKKTLEEKIKDLVEKIEKNKVKEVILALNSNLEGRNTILWLKRQLSRFPNLKITQLAVGLPLGSELEYANEETITSALEGRK